MGVVAVRLRFSAIPLYIAAGIWLGPGEWDLFHLVTPSAPLDLISRLGIVLLLFYLGLEFSIDRITQARRATLIGGLLDLAIAGGGALVVAILLVGVSAEAALLAGMMYISSSAVITRALFDYGRLADPETDLVLGILVVEDLAIALFLGVAAALASGQGGGAGPILLTGALSLVTVLLFLVASKYAHEWIDRIGRRLAGEQLLFAALFVAVGCAALAEQVGLSEAIGALLAGVLLSKSELRDSIEQSLLSLRDFAAGVFFFSFGLTVEVDRFDTVATWLIIAVPVAIIAKLVVGMVAGHFAGLSRRRSFGAGTSLVARGEFSVILSQLAVGGVALDTAFRGKVGAFSGGFVVLTTFTGVLLMRESRRIGRWLFRSANTRNAERKGS
jgi:CPA2 family monovalent cation:H+ antiporter-2